MNGVMSCCLSGAGKSKTYYGLFHFFPSRYPVCIVTLPSLPKVGLTCLLKISLSQTPETLMIFLILIYGADRFVNFSIHTA